MKGKLCHFVMKKTLSLDQILLEQTERLIE